MTEAYSSSINFAGTHLQKENNIVATEFDHRTNIFL